MLYQFIGDCRHLRDAGHEQNWQGMLRQAKSMTESQFVQAVDFTRLLGEGETFDDWVTAASDPTTAFYQSRWGTKPCAFVQTCGFEFIFQGG